jgi:hypothetical protein
VRLSFFLSLEGPKGSKEHEGVSLCETLCASWPGVPRLFFLSLKGAKDSKELEGVSLCETLCASWLGAKTLPFFFRSKSLRARRCTKLGFSS